jgi:hypothetical protein
MDNMEILNTSVGKILLIVVPKLSALDMNIVVSYAFVNKCTYMSTIAVNTGETEEEVIKKAKTDSTGMVLLKIPEITSRVPEEDEEEHECGEGCDHSHGEVKEVDDEDEEHPADDEAAEPEDEEEEEDTK